MMMILYQDSHRMRQVSARAWWRSCSKATASHYSLGVHYVADSPAPELHAE